VPVGLASTFYLQGAGFDMTTIDAVTTTMASQQGLDFVFAGWLEMRAYPGFDLLSYASIAFRNYVLHMSWDENGNVTFTADDSGVAAVLQTEVPVGQAQTMPAQMPGVNIYRPGSLGGTMPLSINQLVVNGGGTAPKDLAFLPVKTTPATGSAPDFTKPWLGLVCDLDLGSNGAVGARALLSAQFLFTWAPGAPDGGYAVWFKICGPDGFPLSLDIEGVVKLGAQTLTLFLNQGSYVLGLNNLSLTILSKSFPGGGAADLYLGGFVDGTQRGLGWFGGYARKTS
jgi:hypothetical protein